MADTSTFGPLPDYENPPLVETILGVQFDRLPRARNAHFGAFWKSLDASEWPSVTDAPLLPPQYEQFGATSSWARGLQFSISQDPASRLQIRNADGDRMIQVQNNRLHFNWLRGADKEYPRYEKVRDGFVSALQQFEKFIADESLGDFRPNQWEVTYLNQIPIETVWSTPRDWEFFRPLAPVPTVQGLIEGESFSGEWHFVIPQQQGRLHVQWKHGKVESDSDGESAPELIRVTLTARGPVIPHYGDLQPILDGLDLGRATIVRSFKDLMSDEANRYWGMKP